jgi:hypothetical protein
LNITQKQKLGVSVLGRNTRLEALEDVQFGEIGFGFIQIPEIMPAPAEGLAFGMFNASGIDLSFLQNILVLGGEVFTHNGDDANIGEVAGRKGKECAGAA